MGTAALQNPLATPPEAEYMSALRISDSTQHKYVHVSQDMYPQYYFQSITTTWEAQGGSVG